MNIGQISDPTVRIKPSAILYKYIGSIKTTDDMPQGISSIVFKNKTVKSQAKFKEPQYLMTETDWKVLNNSQVDPNINMFDTLPPIDDKDIEDGDKLLNLQDLYWLRDYVNRENETNLNKVYVHELLKDSQIILPKNSQVPRNPELEKRCQQLRVKQQNQEYQKMTKNVDNARRRHPEDTIAYQMKQMNRHLIAIFQFIVSVLAGFAFGFIGVELIIGSLDFGFRLLLGIICALVIALAELYFLAKKLNEDLQFETEIETKTKNTKVD